MEDPLFIVQTVRNKMKFLLVLKFLVIPSFFAVAEDFVYGLDDIPVFKEINTTKHYGSSYEDIDRRVPNVSKIKEDLGWEATTKLEDGIKITLNWAKLNRET